jgi:D-alanyl-D-alanine carboxypeptidase (penicillin-binding protein 5/6)
MINTKLFRKFLLSVLAFIFCIALSGSAMAIDEAYIWSTLDETVNVSASLEDVLENQENTLGLESGSAILIEQTTGKVLYAYNVHEQLRPASVTKIMSILLIMEQIEQGKLSLEDKIPCSENASAMGGSQIWLNTTETLTADEMLKAICVVSANDCVVAMAEYIGGTEENFVSMMNEKAKELGMNDTTFKNCHGIDEDGHVTSAYDISIMSRELLTKYPQITNYTTIYMDSLRDGQSELVNTNKLVRNYEGCTGLKTGSTSLALYNLSASATRDGMSLIAVVMKASTSAIRFSEATKLLDYGFNNFSFTQFGTAGDVVRNVTVNKGISATVDVSLENNCSVLIEKGREKEVSQAIEINENIKAPVSKGEILGKVTYTLDGEVISSTNLVATNNVKQVTIFSMSGKVLGKWFNLLR